MVLVRQLLRIIMHAYRLVRVGSECKRSFPNVDHDAAELLILTVYRNDQLDLRAARCCLKFFYLKYEDSQFLNMEFLRFALCVLLLLWQGHTVRRTHD